MRSLSPRRTISGLWLTHQLAMPHGHRVRQLNARQLIDGVAEIRLPHPDLDADEAQLVRNLAADDCAGLSLSMDICGYDYMTMTN